MVVKAMVGASGMVLSRKGGCGGGGRIASGRLAGSLSLMISTQCPLWGDLEPGRVCEVSSRGVGWDGMIGQKPGGKIRKRKYKIYTCSSSMHAGQLSGADDSTASTAH